MYVTKQKVARDISKGHEVNSGAFDLQNTQSYLAWRENKLKCYPKALAEITVNIADPFAMTANERRALLGNCQRANMAIYQISDVRNTGKEVPRAIAEQLGLSHIDNHLCVDEDGISPLHVSENKVRQDYIPYTNRPINWHTDGYYNLLDHSIKGMVLHCVSPAASGGENDFVDHELAYMMLRDKNPEYIQVLMQDDVMTIPPNIQDGQIIRDEQTGPVFTIMPDGNLHMRYTARTHSIEWKDEPLVQEAVDYLLQFLNSNSPYIFRHQMQAGQGIVCNNVLHKRLGFIDDPQQGRQRLIYRARYYDRIVQDN